MRSSKSKRPQTPPKKVKLKQSDIVKRHFSDGEGEYVKFSEVKSEDDEH